MACVGAASWKFSRSWATMREAGGSSLDLDDPARCSGAGGAGRANRQTSARAARRRRNRPQQFAASRYRLCAWSSCAPSGIRTKGRSTTSPRANDLLPRDTAVAATTSETVSATVAISSSATARRFDNVFSVRGRTKPGLPGSSAWSSSFANQLALSHHGCGCRHPFGRTGAGALKKQGDFVSFG